MPRRAVNLLAALLVPFVLQAVFLVVQRTLQLVPADVADFSLYLSEIIGFLFLAFEFRWYSVPMGLAYFPAMTFLLIGFSLDFVGHVYHDWP